MTSSVSHVNGFIQARRWKMRVSVVQWSVALVVLLAMLACVPRTAPAPAPLQDTPVAQPAVPALAAPMPSREDETWAKVVAAAKKEGVVTLYSQSFVSDIGRRIADDFGKKFGIKVEILTNSGAILKERILMEQRLKIPVADIMTTGGASSMSELVLKGGTERIAHELPILRDKAAFRVDPVYSPGGEMVSVAVYFGGVLFNSNLVKPEEVRSYNDLLDPKWRGKFLSPDPSIGGGTSFFYALRYHKVLDLDFYRRLAKQDIKRWGGNTREGFAMVARGEYSIFLNVTTDAVAPLMAEGAPLKVMVAEEGNTGSTSNIAVVKDGPHPNAARVFINWLLSPEGQISYGESSGSTPIRKDVPDFITPGARITPKKTWLLSWEVSEWVVKDMAAKTMEQVFGSK